jgi:hypothetical protein
MTAKLAELIRQADALSQDEQKVLLSHLANRQSNGAGTPAPRRWAELRGRAPGLVGTDAQAWVTRSRREDQANSDRGDR